MLAEPGGRSRVAVGYAQEHHQVVLVTGSRLDGTIEADLPLYVTVAVESNGPAGTRRGWWRRAGTAVMSSAGPLLVPVAPVAHTGGHLSPCFSRVIDLPGDDLSVVVLQWWAHAAVDGTALIGDRLLVSALRVDSGLWSLLGHLRRGGGRRALPVAVELWAHTSRFTRMTMTPRANVVTSGRYFGVGNGAHDCFARELVERSGRLGDRDRGEGHHGLLSAGAPPAVV